MPGMSLSVLNPWADRRARGLFLGVLLAVVAAFSLLGQQEAKASNLPPGFVENEVVHPLSKPTSMVPTPDGRMLMTEQGGRLLVFKNGAVLPTPALTLSVDSSGERGLIGITVDPAFATNGWLYVTYTSTTPAVHNRISRFTMVGDTIDPATEFVVLDIDNLSTLNQHNAGHLDFGADGKLYIAVGDNQAGDNAQSMNTLKGKILRINPDGTFPTDNPFHATATGKNKAIYALGFRNPFTFDIQPGTGRIYVNDVGQDSWEEVDEVRSGGNYGWPATEGYTSDPAYVSPVFAYPHGFDGNSGCAVTGGAFYNPTVAQFPDQYVGKYFVIDYCTLWIKTIDPETRQVADFANGFNKFAIGVTVGSEGSLYYFGTAADNKASMSKISYTGSLAPSIGTQPADQLVSTGHSASFSVSASGYRPLSYQWSRNDVPIPDATADNYTTPPLDLTEEGSTYSVAVTNGYGSVTSRHAVVHMTTNQPPTISIDTPVEGATYSAGDVISYSGSAGDAEDGTPPPSAFTWRVDIGHHAPGTPNAHFHPFIPDTPGATSGSFTAPTGGETDPDVYYRITLTVTDSAGLTTTSFRDVMPNTVTVTLASNPSGLLVKLDGSPVTAPYTFTGVVGVTRNVGVYSPQTVAGVVYAFDNWSDGGTAQHTLSTPAADTVYTANYKNARQGTISANPNPVQVCDVSATGTTSLTWSTSGVTAVDVRLNSPSGGLFASSGPGTKTRVTGNWVKEGLVIYLQDRSGGAPLTADNTLASVVLHVTNAGCPTGTISANPNPVQVCDGSGTGTTSLTWTTNNTTTVEVRIGSPTGSRFSVSATGTQTRATGKWVTEGMVFYLQDVSVSTPGPTLATVTAHVTSVGCPPTASIAANPNPVQVCSGTTGTTTLTWTASGPSKVEVHLNSPTGSRFAATGPGTQTRPTGNWVTEGMVFYLQDVSAGSPGTTLTTVTAHLTQQGCTPTGSISASPNPVQVCDGTGKGVTTVTWSSSAVSSAEVHIGSPSGALFSRQAKGSLQTGKWVAEGTTFYLQNTSGGLPLTSANTLASVVAHVTTTGCPPAASRAS
jgi:glucose/arabinose dehydrogenase